MENGTLILNTTIIPSPDLVKAAADRYKRDLIVLTLMSLIVISVNLLIIIAFFVDHKLRNRSANVLIFSQAGSDLFTGLVFVPLYLVEAYYQTYVSTGFFICYILFLSLFNLLALSTDRYLALSRPFLHYKIIDLPRTIKVIVFIWIIPLFLTLIPLTWRYKSTEFHQEAMRIYLGFVWLFMLALVIVMTILYSFVTFKARRTIRRKRESIGGKSSEKMATLVQKELRVIHLFGLLLFFFAATYLPLLYMNLCDLIGRSDMVPVILEEIQLYLLLLNSIVNPILCIYLKKDYYQEIRRLLLCQKQSRRNWHSTYGGETETMLLRKTTHKKQQNSDEFLQYNKK